MRQWRGDKRSFNRTGKKRVYRVKSAGIVDFRGDNEKNIKSLKENSIDLYSSTKSIYLQNKDRKIKNSDVVEDNDWGNLDN